jgi:hypothetical protein
MEHGHDLLPYFEPVEAGSQLPGAPPAEIVDPVVAVRCGAGTASERSSVGAATSAARKTTRSGRSISMSHGYKASGSSTDESQVSTSMGHLTNFTVHRRYARPDRRLRTGPRATGSHPLVMPIAVLARAPVVPRDGVVLKPAQ